MDKADMDENYTYIVRCADGTLYTGWTNDLKKRNKKRIMPEKAPNIQRHADLWSWSTSSILPQKRRQ